jgi:molybdate transport system permease protein
MPSIWDITWLTVSLALVATTITLPPGVILAWVLARREFKGKTFVETLVSLPLVMPPVATGLILLYLVGRRSAVGRLLMSAGIEILFTWKAVVLAMAVMSFPLVVRTARAGFEQVSTRYEDIAATLGAGPARIFLTVSLPLALPGVLAGGVLGFSRAVGEFGATVMVAGALPGSTRTLAVAIYTFSETGQDREAAWLLAASVVIAFVAMWVANRVGEVRRA